MQDNIKIEVYKLYIFRYIFSNLLFIIIKIIFINRQLNFSFNNLKKYVSINIIIILKILVLFEYNMI